LCLALFILLLFFGHSIPPVPMWDDYDCRIWSNRGENVFQIKFIQNKPAV